MKFDLTIMNPPYSGNLHLKILERVIPACTEVANISPTGYLDDIAAVRGWKNTTFQRFETSVAKHIKRYHRISPGEANTLLGIGTFTSNSITIYDNGEHKLYKEICYEGKLKSFFDKVIVKVYKGEVDSIGDNVKLSTIHGHPGMRDEFDIVTTKKDIAQRFKPERMSEKDWDNFHNSCQTIFMKYCNFLTRQGQNLQTHLLPWMGDYSEPWTDGRFREYFSITDEEWAQILETMSKYKY